LGEKNSISAVGIRALNEKEVDYVVALIMGWIAQQFDKGGHKSGHKTL